MALAAALLAGCAGGSGGTLSTRGAYAPTATGPIRSACLASDRAAKSPALCGCIQAVADGELNRREQRQAVKFFRDPHQAQEMRQSDRPKDRSYWALYKAFTARAESTCR